MTSSSIERICIFRALTLGDMICATPALRALRARYPDAHITLVGLPGARDFAQRLSAWIDAFEAFPGHPDLPEQPCHTHAPFAAWAQGMREQRYDLAVQLHGSGRASNRIVEALGARLTVGFLPEHDALNTPEDGRLYWPYPDGLHEIHRCLGLAKQLGADDRDDEVFFPLDEYDGVDLNRHADLAALAPGQFFCLHPGGHETSGRWAPEHFAAVGDALACNGWRAVITGDAGEHDLAAEVQARMRTPAINAARSLSVGALAALLSRSRLLVANDMGVAHIAAALRLPSVVVSVTPDAARRAPLDRLRHRCVTPPAGEHGVAPAAVAAAALPLLDLPPELRSVAAGTPFVPGEWPAAAHPLPRGLPTQ